MPPARTSATTPVVTEEPSTASLLAYPNPVTGSELQIKVEAQAGDKLVITLHDLKGSAPVLRTEQVAAGKGQSIKLQTGQVPSGTWILKVENRTSHRIATTKVVRLQ